MLKKITILTYLMFFISCNSQNTLAGKTYKAEVSASCEKFKNGGGCMIYDYCILDFKKNIVNVSYSTKASCTPKEIENNYKINQSEKMQYGYTIKNNIVNIKNFNTYGKLFINQKKLIGRKEMNENEFSKLEFEQQ